MEHKELTEKIIGCAFKVFNTLGAGYLESVYEKAMAIELRNAGLNAEFQVPVPVFYEGQQVGDFYADILVDGLVIVEIKAVRKLNVAHEVQLVNYLTATGIEVGLLINFGDDKVEVRRKVRSLPPHPGDPVIPSNTNA